MSALAVTAVSTRKTAQRPEQYIYQTLASRGWALVAREGPTSVMIQEYGITGVPGYDDSVARSLHAMRSTQTGAS